MQRSRAVYTCPTGRSSSQLGSRYQETRKARPIGRALLWPELVSRFLRSGLTAGNRSRHIPPTSFRTCRPPESEHLARYSDNP